MGLLTQSFDGVNGSGGTGKTTRSLLRPPAGAGRPRRVNHASTRRCGRAAIVAADLDLAVSARNRNQVGAEAEERGLRLDRSGRLEDDVPVAWMVQAWREVLQPMCHALDADGLADVEPGLGGLLGQLLRPVEVRRREPAGVTRGVHVLTGREILLHNRPETGIEQVRLCESVEERGKP